jgi:hypothetical protein
MTAMCAMSDAVCIRNGLGLEIVLALASEPRTSELSLRLSIFDAEVELEPQESWRALVFTD